MEILGWCPARFYLTDSHYTCILLVHQEGIYPLGYTSFGRFSLAAWRITFFQYRLFDNKFPSKLQISVIECWFFRSCISCIPTILNHDLWMPEISLWNCYLMNLIGKKIMGSYFCLVDDLRFLQSSVFMVIA